MFKQMQGPGRSLLRIWLACRRRNYSEIATLALVSALAV
jgi:hypothetical protein